MRFFILGDIFSGLRPWLICSSPNSGMPAVYNFYKKLGESTEHNFYSIIVNKEINREIIFENGSIIRLIKVPKIPFHLMWKLFAFICALVLSYRIVKANKFDVLYGMTIYSTITAVIGRHFNVFSVSRMFGSLLTGLLKEKKYYRIYSRFLFEVIAFKMAGNLLISTNDGTKPQVASEYFNHNKEIFLFYNGMEKQLLEKLISLPLVQTLPTNGLKICYIGRFSYWKRHDIALKVIEKIITKYDLKDTMLTFLGDGPDESDIKNLINKKGLKENVTFHPLIPQANMSEFLKDFHIAMYLYDSGNLGNSLWESALSGRLICTRNTGDTGKIFKDGINSIIVNDSINIVDDLSSKIVSYIGKDISQIVKRGRIVVSEIITNWDIRIEKELKLITKTKKLHETNGTE